MKNVIVNGSFSNPNGITYGWIAHNISITKDSSQNDYYLSDGEKNVYYDLPPGLYQKIDLSNYYYDVRLDIEYAIHYNNDVAASREEDLISNFYIYRISSYDSSTKIPVIGDVRDYVIRKSANIDYDDKIVDSGLYVEETNDFSIMLPPGYYVLGFGSSYIDINGDGFIADGGDLNGLCIKHIEANALELESGIINLISTNDCEGYAVETASFPRDNNFSCPDALEALDIGIRASSNDTLNSSITKQNGYGADFNVPELSYVEGEAISFDIVGRISFWYHSSLIGSRFAVCIYDTILNKLFGDPKLIDIEENEWTQCIIEFSAGEGEYKLLIIPPQDSYKKDYLMLNKVNLSLEINIENSNQGGKGTFEEPYNKYDGYIYYEYNGKGDYIPRFIPDNFKTRDSIFFVNIDGQYYMSYEGSTTYVDVLCSDGFYNSNGLKISNPNTTSDLRYFFKDGSMAVSESFAYGDDIYTADENGICAFTSKIMKKIELALNGYDYPINSIIDIAKGTSATIIATFERQNPYVKLTVTSSNEEVATGFINDETDLNLKYDDNGYYNESNTIKINGWHIGTATITVSCEALDGSVISKSFEVDVRDIREYYKNGESIVSLDFLYDKNYITYGESLDLKYRLKPLISSSLPVDFQIVDPYNYFTISNGVLTATTTKVLNYSCTVSITNYGSNKTDTCTIYLVPTKNMPIGIRFIDYKSKMEVGEVVDAVVETYGEDKKSTNITQNVTWSSDKPYIASVDELGTITALSPGDALITCACVENPSLTKTVNVEVVGSVTGETIALQRIDLNMQEAVILGANIGDLNGKISCEYLEYSLYPGATQQKSVIWSSDDESLVRVDQNGKVYCNRNRSYGTTFKQSTYVRCTSAHNPNISASCKVTVCGWGAYKPIIYFSKSSVNAFVNEEATINYGVSNCSYIEYDEQGCNVTLTREDGSETTSTVSFNKNTITVLLKEEGTYIVTVACGYKKGNAPGSISNTCTIVATKSNYTPIISKDLELCYALHNGSYILRYYAENDISENFTHYVGVDGTFDKASGDKLIYNGENYYYIFGKIEFPGTYEVCVKVVNGTTYSNTTNTITVTMPDTEDGYQESLDIAKQEYDVVTDDIINYLKALITDKTITLNEHLEFETRLKLFNTHYENLKFMLDACIDIIDQGIKEEQAEMSTMATALTSDGTAVATYSMDDATNSNYKNVTDMDYYQNECIKALIQKVLELEAKLNELSNNNNN